MARRNLVAPTTWSKTTNWKVQYKQATTSGDKRRVVVAPHRNLPREQQNDD